jgi:hypothetical protein
MLRWANEEKTTLVMILNKLTRSIFKEYVVSIIYSDVESFVHYLFDDVWNTVFRVIKGDAKFEIRFKIFSLARNVMEKIFWLEGASKIVQANRSPSQKNVLTIFYTLPYANRKHSSKSEYYACIKIVSTGTQLKFENTFKFI